jgi:Na+-driven multidrug efflux pump
MYSQGLGAIVNIILDPCFIFGLGFFPKMGVKGAAVATVIGQTSAAILGLFLNIKYNDEIEISPRKYHPSLPIIGKIYSVGIPSIIMQSIGSVMTFGMNKILISFSTTAVAVFGVYFKLQSFIFMPVFGLNNGLIPVMAYNYGARYKKRILETLKYGMIYACSIMAVGTVIMQIFPRQLLGFFEASDTMLAIGIPALRIISLHFVIAAFGIILSSSLQALGHGIYAMIMSFTRQLVVLLPAAYLLSKTGDIDNIWWAFIIAVCFSVTVGVLSFTKVKRSQIDNMN